MNCSLSAPDDDEYAGTCAGMCAKVTQSTTAAAVIVVLNAGPECRSDWLKTRFSPVLCLACSLSLSLSVIFLWSSLRALNLCYTLWDALRDLQRKELISSLPSQFHGENCSKGE